jgi:hypothetical protein
MPDMPFPDSSADNQPFDLNTANDAIGQAIASIVKVTFRAPGSVPAPAEAAAVMDSLRNAVLAGAQACTEITRIRAELAVLRDEHRPRPHADSSAPGALCTACSVHGSIVSWPCSPWTADERILTHGKA